jgi:hypothetical protein
MKRKFKKNNRFKRSKIFQRDKITIIYYPKIFKEILILIMVILAFFVLGINKKEDLFNLPYSKKEINNIWIKNRTEFLNYFLPNITEENNQTLMKDINRIEKYFSLKIYLKDENCSLNLEAKENLKHEFEEEFEKNFSLVKNVYIKYAFSFGNQIIALNNIIYYCEILGIKNIYLNSKFEKWYIKNNITTDKIHISLLPRKAINCNSPETFCAHIYPHLFYPRVIKPERRSLILKEEILSNLPKIQTKENDLYIYIRSGDMFQKYGNIYSPIPYCFYQRALNNFKFNDIYIIASDDKNPIIGKLLADYPNIKYKMNKVEEDISTLIHAHNLINCVSSFTQAAIAFNDYLKNIFEYEIYKLADKIYHFHYDFDKLNRTFNVYRMIPSEYYFRKMYDWQNKEKQRKLLFEEKCKYDFRKTIYGKIFFG